MSYQNYQYQNEAKISHMNMFFFIIQNTKLAKFPAFIDEAGRCLAFTAFEKQTYTTDSMLPTFTLVIINPIY